jgi:hypothetical protein
MEAVALTSVIGAQFLAAIVSISTRELIYREPKSGALDLEEGLPFWSRFLEFWDRRSSSRYPDANSSARALIEP